LGVELASLKLLQS